MDFVESGGHFGKHMATAEHGGAEGHEVCYGVVAIADEFLEVVGD